MARKVPKEQMSLFETVTPEYSKPGSYTQAPEISNLSFAELVREQILRDCMTLRLPDDHINPDREFYERRVVSFKEYLEDLNGSSKESDR